MELTENRIVEVRQGHYGPYIAMGHKRRLSLHEDKYNWVLVSNTSVKAINTQKIDDLLMKKEKRNLHLSGNQYVTVRQFRGMNYVGFFRRDVRGEVMEGNIINLIGEEWDMLNKHLPTLLQQLKRTQKEVCFKMAQFYFVHVVY